MKLILSILLLIAMTEVKCQDWYADNRESKKLYDEGNYSESIKKADQALDIARKKYGEISNEYTTSLTNKAYSQANNGDLLNALASFKRIVEITFEQNALPHNNQMEALEKVADTYIKLAIYDSAEIYLNQAFYIYNAVFEQNKAHYDTSQLFLFNSYLRANNLNASLHHKKGQVSEAINLLEYQKQIILEVYVDDYRELDYYQSTINNLANYYNEIYDIDNAKKYAREYLDLIDKENDQLDLINALQNLGSIYRNNEQNDSAIYYWNKALDKIENGNYGSSYIHTAVMNNLGALYLDLEDYEQAALLLEQSLKIQQSRNGLQPMLYQTTLYNLAECYHWAGNYLQADSIYKDLINKILSEIAHNFTYLSDNEKISFYKNQQIFIDSFVSFALGISGTIPLQQTDDPYISRDIVGRLYNVQLSTKAIILNASKRMKNQILNSGDQELIKSYVLWEKNKNELAQALLDGKSTSDEISTLKSIIEENEKWLISRSRSFQSGFQNKVVSWKQIQQQLQPNEAAVEIIRMIDGLVYGALIITSETTEQPILSLVISKEEKYLEQQFYKKYAASVLYQLEDTSSYQTYWSPIINTILSQMPEGKMPERIYISNDGIYNQINLNTLYNPASKKYVLDETEIVLLTNSKELLANPEISNKVSAKKAALYGQPKFSTQDSVRIMFNDLPGTGLEVQLIDSLLENSGWNTMVYSQEKATEESFKDLEYPNIIHLASHGFFNATANNDVITMAETMIRSGIALAGANNVTHSGDDGLLTAYELTNIDLDSTYLIVLSACETAKGQVSQGEGVYGLQRAARVAGAQYMIMSLWKVDDTATQKLMTAFYRNWMESQDIRTAFSSAQKQLREEYPSPFYWGAFVLAGK